MQTEVGAHVDDDGAALDPASRVGGGHGVGQRGEHRVDPGHLEPRLQGEIDRAPGHDLAEPLPRVGAAEEVGELDVGMAGEHLDALHPDVAGGPGHGDATATGHRAFIHVL